MHRRANDQHGQVLPLAAVLLAGTVALALLVVLTGEVLVDRARATTAADAAALAGAAEDRTAAEELAAANGGRIEEYALVDGETVVVVRVGRARATARARLDPSGGGATGWPG